MLSNSKSCTTLDRAGDGLLEWRALPVKEHQLCDNGEATPGLALNRDVIRVATETESTIVSLYTIGCKFREQAYAAMFC